MVLTTLLAAARRMQACLGPGFRLSMLSKAGARPAVVGVAAMAALSLLSPGSAQAQTIRPVTWNVVGLDSNNVKVGPNRFPVGARICAGGTALNAHNARFTWLSSNPYVNLPGEAASQDVALNIGANTCQDVFFEVTVTRNKAAYTTTRRYEIEVLTSGGAPLAPVLKTPANREIYVEYLISQNRNKITGYSYDGGPQLSPGSSITVGVGQTFNLELRGSTATQGYEQLEKFIELDPSLFRVNKVTSTYSANAGTDPNAGTQIYADGCGWQNDYTSPSYHNNLTCSGVGKYGGTVTQRYNITVIAAPAAPATSVTSGALIYDFSGSSYHYNADFSAGGITFIFGTPPPPTTADVQMSKSSSGTSGNLRFTLAVTNLGPGDASNVVVTDTVPSTCYVIKNNQGWPGTVSQTGNTVTWSVGSLALGATQTIDILVNRNANGTACENTACVASSSDPESANDCSSAVASDVVADLAVSKTATPSLPNVGDTATFVVTVRNQGPNVATDVVVADPLPTGYTILSVTPSVGTYTAPNWTIGSLASGASATLTIRGTVQASGTFVNTATASTTARDPDSTNNAASAAAPPTFLSIAKATSSSFVPGGSGTFTVTVSKTGDASLGTITMADVAPTGMSVTGLSGAGWTCDVPTATCTRPDDIVATTGFPLPYPDISVTVLIAEAPVPSSLTNVAYATSSNGSSYAEATRTISIATPPDMASSVSCTPSPAFPGALVSCAVTCTNVGAATANGATCSVPNAASLPTGATVVCPNAGAPVDVTPGSSLGCTVFFNAPSSGPVVVQAATAATNDVNPANDPSSATVPVDATPAPPDTADMVSTVSCSPTPGSIGAAVVCTAVCENIGTATATGATCSIDTTGLPGTPTLTCSAPGSVAPGGVQACTLTFVPIGSTPLIIKASATATNDADGGTDPLAGNNPSNITVPINPTPTGADMTSRVQCTPNPASSGQSVSCTVTCTNVGTVTATAALCTFPDAASLPGSPSTAACPSSQTVGVGSSIACTISFTANGSLVAVLGGSGAANDVNGGSTPTAGNNPSVTPVVVGPSANLSVQKSGTASVTAGGAVDYSIVVTNQGPAAADGATLSDAIAAGSGFTGSSNAVVCAVTTGAATCPGSLPTALEFVGGTAISLANFPSGSSLTFTFSGTAGAAAGTITNTATLTPPPGVTPGSPVTSSWETLVDPPEANLKVDKSGPSPVAPNATLQYTIRVTNEGPAAANGARLQDPAVTGFTATAVTCSAGPTAACPIPVAPATTLSVLDLQRSGLVIPTLPANGYVEFTLTGSAAASGSITNYATVFPPKGVFDPDITDNTDSAFTIITTNPNLADLFIQKRAVNIPTAPNPETPIFEIGKGEQFKYRLTIGNSNTSTVGVTNAVVTDVQPSNVEFLSVTCEAAIGVSCSQLGSPIPAGALTTGLTVPSLPVGSQFDLVIVAKASPLDGVIVNNATVAAPQNGPLDPNPLNNFGTAITPISFSALASVDLVVVKTGPSSIGSAGTLTYKILVRNKGPGNASGAKLFDVLAGTLTAPTVTCTKPANSEANCPDPATVTWADISSTGIVLTSMPPPSGINTSSLEFTVTGTAGSGGVVFNTASVSPPPGAYDSDPRDNSSSVSTVIISSGPGADLKVVKTGPSSAAPGSEVTYTISVMNLGSVDANGALLRDPAVANFTAESVSCANTGFPAGTCPSFPTVLELQSGVVIPSLPVGSALQFTLVGRAGNSGSIVNTATIYSPPGLSDPVLTNNSSTKTTSLGGGGPSPDPGTISGFVWYDTNGNNAKDPSEPPRGGWRVELVLGGSVVATAITSADGFYTFSGLTPGSYTVRFASVPRDAIPGGGPVNGDSSGNGGSPSGMELTGINIANGVSVVNQSLPIDPSGVVYEATARTPIAGATVTLLYNGSPANPLYVAGGSNRDVSAAGGQYAFFLLPGAPTGTWGLRIDASVAYEGTPSLLIAPTPAPAGFTGGSVGTVGVPPTGAITTYYLAFPLPTVDITNNNIPLDGGRRIPAISPALLALLGILLAIGTGWATRQQRREH